IVTLWSPILSLTSAATLPLKKLVAPASGHGQFAWWQKSCEAVGNGGCGAGNLGRHHHSRSDRMLCLLHSMPARSWAAFMDWVGQSQQTSSTCLRSFATALTA